MRRLIGLATAMIGGGDGHAGHGDQRCYLTLIPEPGLWPDSYLGRGVGGEGPIRHYLAVW